MHSSSYNEVILWNSTAADELKAEQLVELPLELCKVMVRGISCGLANGASLLPSFMHRLEGLLLAIQLRKTLSQSYPEASQVSANLVNSKYKTLVASCYSVCRVVSHLTSTFPSSEVYNFFFMIVMGTLHWSLRARDHWNVKSLNGGRCQHRPSIYTRAWAPKEPRKFARMEYLHESYMACNKMFHGLLDFALTPL